MKALRIIINVLNIGGTEKHLSIVLPALAAQGWKIKIITLQKTQENNLLAVLREAGITIDAPREGFYRRFLPRILRRGINVLQSFWRLWREFRRDKFILTHFFLPEAYLIGMAAAACAHLRAVTIMSRRSLNDYQKHHPILRSVERWCHRRVHFILGNSDRIMQQLQHEERVPKKKLVKIYNGIDVSHYANNHKREEVRRQLIIAQDELVFIMVANLISYKGHEDLLRALHLIKSQLPPSWRLLCVGRDDQMLSHLQQVTDSLGLSAHVFWLGARQDISNLISAADIGVLCSHQEGFSNAILEYMAAKLPIVVTDVGGNREAVTHEITGLMVPARDINALAQALLRLAKDKTLGHAMGAVAQRRVNEYFSLPACVTAYEEFYRHVKDKTICVD